MKVVVCHDPMPTNPYEDDTLGSVVALAFHGMFRQKRFYRMEDYGSWDALERRLKRDGAFVILPLYGYKHSGFDVSTNVEPSWHHYPWDGGRIGFLCAFRDDAKKIMGWGRITEERKQRAKEIILKELDEYRRYLNEDAYMFCVYNDDGTLLETYGSIYADDEDELRALAKEITGCDEIEFELEEVF